MSFHQPDPSHAPAPSIGQQFELFLRNWWKVGEFALQTARTSKKLFALEAYPVDGWRTTAFLSAMFRFDGDTQATQVIISKIDRTQEILSWKKKPLAMPESDENLWINYIGNN